MIGKMVSDGAEYIRAKLNQGGFMQPARIKPLYKDEIVYPNGIISSEILTSKINEIVRQFNACFVPCSGEERLEKLIYELVHSGYVRHFNSDDVDDEKEIAKRLAHEIMRHKEDIWE